MKRVVLLFLICALAATAASAGPFLQPANPTNDDNYIVVFRRDVVDRVTLPNVARGVAVGALAERMAHEHMGLVQRVYSHALDGALMTMSDKQARILARSPGSTSSRRTG